MITSVIQQLSARQNVVVRYVARTGQGHDLAAEQEGRRRLNGRRVNRGEAIGVLVAEAVEAGVSF